MNSRTPYSSHIAGRENHDSASDLNTFPTWPQTPQMQADADLVHDAQLVFPEASLGLAFQATSLQTQSYVWQQILLPQDDAGLLRILQVLTRQGYHKVNLRLLKHLPLAN